MVCYGNVCRSPYMQAVLNRELPNVITLSAGFVGSGRQVPDASAAISARRGLDLSQFRSSPLTPTVVNTADMVIVMDNNQARELMARYPITRRRIIVAGDLDPVFDATRGIRDPWNQASEVFEACFDRLDRCVETLAGAIRPRLANLSGTRTSASRVTGTSGPQPTMPVADAPHLQPF